MAQGPDHQHPPRELTRPASAIREAIARTRDDLASHLAALRDRLLNPAKFLGAQASPEAEADMATKSTKRKPSASPSSRAKGSQDEARKKTTTPPKEKASSEKSGASARGKAKSAAKSSDPSKTAKVSARGKTGGTRKKAGKPSLAARTGEVLDTALAGAVVGAVTGAAQTLAQEPTAVTNPAEASCAPEAGGPKPASTSEVLSEMAPGAALGALAGAAKAVMPPAPKTPARRTKR